MNFPAYLLLTLTLISACSRESRLADSVLFNGKIVTVNSAFSIEEAVAIRDGRILQVGSSSDILELAGDSTSVIDLKGLTVIPGLIEGHAHPIAASESEYFESIPVLNSIEETLAWIRSQASKKDDDEWIIHPKFFITRMKDMRQISLGELDLAAPRNPVFLNGSYGGIVNTRALQLSGIENLNHSGILRDKKTGRPAGLIRRSAFPLLKLPPPGKLEASRKYTLLKNLLKRYNSVGFTSVCSGGGTIDELEVFKEMRRRDELTVRIFHNVRVPVDPGMTEEALSATIENLGMKTGAGDQWVRVGAFKVVLDGGMLTGTAFLHNGWGEKAKDLYGIDDPDYRGELMYSKAGLVKIIRAAAENGWKFTAHVTGGGGVDTLLAAYESVNSTLSLKDKRFSIIHGNFFTSDAIATMKELGIYADMQPAWFYKDADLLHHVLGSERMKTFHPYASLVESGIMVNGGSDHMVKLDPDLSINPYNPFTAMWAVVTRKTERGTVFNPEQAISRQDALKMYTINNAYASFEESIKGSLEKGKFADLVVLSDDILTCSESAIRNIKPVLTIMDGKTVYDAGTLKVSANR